MSFKVDAEIADMITPDDHNALHAIYQHRCLNEQQLTRYIYNTRDDGYNGYTLRRIRALISFGLIEVHEYGPDHKCVFFLTYQGVQYIRDTAGRPMYHTKERSGRRRYEATAGGLWLPDTMLDHQTRLNDLALELVCRCNLDPSCYKDNLFASNFTYAQPDGVLELPERDFFLEMDMGHERMVALRGKWDHYRGYFRSRDYQLHRNKPVTVLFATENVSSLSRRRRTVVKSLARTSMDLLGPQFDCYITSNEGLEEIMERLVLGHPGDYPRVCSLLEEQHGVKFIAPPQPPGTLSPDARLCVAPDGSRFLFLDGSDRPMSGIKRIVYFGQERQALGGARLLVLVPDEEGACVDELASEIRPGPEVCYVTEKRLQRRLFYEALFQFDQLGNRFRLSGPGLGGLIFERHQRRVRKN